MDNGLSTLILERDRYCIEQIKIVLTLTSATLIVSLVSLKGEIIFAYKGVLYLSWIFLITSIIFGIGAITAGANRYDRMYRGKIGKLQGEEKKLYEKGKTMYPVEEQSIAVQVWAFIIGLTKLLIFIVLNIHTIMKW